MGTLSRDNRRLLEQTIVNARGVAERAALTAIEAMAVGSVKPDGHMNDGQKALRNHLRDRARQLGEKRTANANMMLGWGCIAGVSSAAEVRAELRQPELEVPHGDE